MDGKSVLNLNEKPRNNFDGRTNEAAGPGVLLGTGRVCQLGRVLSNGRVARSGCLVSLHYFAGG